MAALAPANIQKFSLDTVWSALKELKFITGFFGWLFLLMGRLAEPCMTLSAIYIVIEAGIPQASVSALHNIAVAIMISAPEVILPGSFILASQARTEGKDARLLTAMCWIFVLLTLITMLSLFVLHMNQSAIALLMCARCATGVGYSILVRILSHKGLPTVHEKQGALTPEIIEQMMQKLLHNLSPTIAETVKCEVTMVLDRLTIPALQNEQQALPAPIEAEIVSPGDAHMTVAKLEVNNYERVKSYLADHPKATLHEIAGALTISVTTANKWRGKIRAESTQGRRKKARSL